MIQSCDRMSENEKPAIEKPIRTPCINVCTLDDDDVCVGCYRTIDEITGWTAMDREQRLECLRRCNSRSQNRHGRWL